MKEKKKHRVDIVLLMEMVGMEGGRRPTGIPAISCKFSISSVKRLPSCRGDIDNSCDQNNDAGVIREDDQYV
jgi:hypothetical protein